MQQNKDYFVIDGFGGAKKIKGKISVNGAKNAVLPAMASSIVFKTPLCIKNIPQIEDVKRMSELLKGLKSKIIHKGKREIIVDSSKASKTVLDREISKRFRASIILIGPILARFGEVSFPHPGGCVLGARPIDLFVEGFKKMGASFEEKDGYYNLKAKNGKLHGAEIVFKLQSVTATETFLLASVLSVGKTTLHNVSLEPEVTSLVNLLVRFGAKIEGVGTTTLNIEGGEMLSASENDFYEVIPDRLEAGSLLILGAMASNNLIIENCDPEHLKVPISILRDTGVDIETGPNFIKIKSDKKIETDSINLRTHEYPGFPTDLQAPMTVFMTQVSKESAIFETIFEGRLNYVNDLIRMGADIKMWDAHHISIKGPTLLKGKEVEGPDIRAGIAFIMAAIVAEGQSIIHNAYFIDRGYESIESRLRKIGVKIRRVKNKI